MNHNIGCIHHATRSFGSLGRQKKSCISRAVIDRTGASRDVTGTIFGQTTAFGGYAFPSPSPAAWPANLCPLPDSHCPEISYIMYLPAFYADSWVEISSQPSSSSLSSAGGDNETVTTGLQICHNSALHRPHRRRRLYADIASGIRLAGRPSSAAGSSQDEYDESESESDRVMSSSNEDISTKDIHGQGISQPDQEGDDDDSIALGSRTTGSVERVFTPQPNAFSHPPSSQASRQGVGLTPTPDSYFPHISSNAPVGTRLASDQTVTPRSIQSFRHRHQQSPATQSTQSQGPSDVVNPSPTYQSDHDAALRASLSTLLSCAAAVRSSPKQQDIPSRTDVPQHNEPTALRLVPESELYGPDHGQRQSLPARRPLRSSPPSSNSLSPGASTKRKSRESSKDRHVKRSRASKTIGSSMDEVTVSPVLMSWMISAGVVLVFSAISFSVGYAWGKEVGRFEGSMAIGPEGAGCGREAVRGTTGGLRRLRWGTTSSSIRA